MSNRMTFEGQGSKPLHEMVLSSFQNKSWNAAAWRTTLDVTLHHQGSTLAKRDNRKEIILQKSSPLPGPCTITAYMRTIENTQRPVPIPHIRPTFVDRAPMKGDSVIGGQQKRKKDWEQLLSVERQQKKGDLENQWMAA